MKIGEVVSTIPSESASDCATLVSLLIFLAAIGFNVETVQVCVLKRNARVCVILRDALVQKHQIPSVGLGRAV